ncbi:TIGR03571 family LLM class oxidoreductase [Delftia sp. CH05]|uniref:TIGR03571 family LLM class oxidoreductase n=1 Tax=Delftia sp. CH05 TaxID=2692194 RepID=UPI00135EA9B0|nr:TIGR03571 family LLM class oxidoreductase [Delftia sp. CH05]MXN30513.1 TIGR03571 family LLM class oxidoreductase [Delftia sp. CH05]
MASFNLAYDRVLAPSRLSLGLMTPLARQLGTMADPALERLAAIRADDHGFAALWTRDVPLMVPQGTELETAALDDPFVWLATFAAATKRVALGTAAAVLPLRHPLHLAKSALSLDRLSGGRFILGVGSGDREAEFAAFGQEAAQREALFRKHWALLRAALSPEAVERRLLLDATGGYDVAAVTAKRIPMLVVGSARQTLQWIARNADGWASYHRDEARQQGRIGLWQSALAERAESQQKPFVQSLHLDLLEDADAPAQPIELGMRTGRKALVGYLARLEAMGVRHVLLHLARGPRSVLDIIDELGLDVLPSFLSKPVAA